jgi:hypothetical protein
MATRDLPFISLGILPLSFLMIILFAILAIHSILDLFN